MALEPDAWKTGKRTGPEKGRNRNMGRACSVFSRFLFLFWGETKRDVDRVTDVVSMR